MEIKVGFEIAYAAEQPTPMVRMNPSPASLVKICPDGAPNCHVAPNFDLRPPVVESARRSGGWLTFYAGLTC